MCESVTSSDFCNLGYSEAGISSKSVYSGSTLMHSSADKFESGLEDEMRDVPWKSNVESFVFKL